MLGRWQGRTQENRTPAWLCFHLPPLRFVPESSGGRCPGYPGRWAAQVRKRALDLSRPGALATWGWEVRVDTAAPEKVGKVVTRGGDKRRPGRGAMKG